MRYIQLVVLTLSLMFSALAFGAAVNVNTANAKALAAAANGIGPAKARAIVEYRKANGDFSSLDDLKKVKGIGPKTVEENRSVLTAGAAEKENGRHPQN